MARMYGKKKLPTCRYGCCGGEVMDNPRAVEDREWREEAAEELAQDHYLSNRVIVPTDGRRVK